MKEINELKKYTPITSVFTGGFTCKSFAILMKQVLLDEVVSEIYKYAAKLGVTKLGSHIGILSIDDNENERKIFRIGV